MKNHFILCFFAWYFNAQVTIKQNKQDNDLKLSALPYYGKGIGITSPDSLYQLNIRFRMQNRVTYLENEDGSYDGQIRLTFAI
jgi:hypothetical protein